MFPDIPYKLYKADNGMRLLIVPHKQASVMNIEIAVKVGSNDETKQSEHGLAHFLEHMCFRSTTKFSKNEVLRRLDNMGASYNAYTTYEQTAYTATFQPKYFEELLIIFFDMLYASKFLSEEIEIERKVILNEIAGKANNIVNLADDLTRILITKDKYEKYRHNIGGSIENVNRFERDDLVKFHKKYNKPDNVLISIFGDVSTDYIKNTVERSLREYIGKISFTPFADLNKLKIGNKSNFAVNKNINENEVHYNDRIVTLYKPLSQTFIRIFFPAYELFNKCSFLIALLSDILTGTMSSDLMYNLREKTGLTYSITSDYNSTLEYGYFHFDTVIMADKLEDALDELLGTFIYIFKHGISEESLNRAKNKHLTKLLLHAQDPMTHSSLHTKYILHNYESTSLNKIYKNIQKASVNDINKLFKYILDPNHMYMIILHNKQVEQQLVANAFTKFYNNTK